MKNFDGIFTEEFLIDWNWWIFSVFSNFEKIRYCPHFVCPCRYYFSGGWPILLVYGSIDSLWLQGMNQGRIFFRPILAPTKGNMSEKTVHFHMKIRFYWYLRRVMSLMSDRVGRVVNRPSDPKSAPDPKSASRPKKCPPTQKVPPNPKSAPRPKKCPST
jgi:hypothetical protein